jgi:hypothetical protein
LRAQDDGEHDPAYGGYWLSRDCFGGDWSGRDRGLSAFHTAFRTPLFAPQASRITFRGDLQVNILHLLSSQCSQRYRTSVEFGPGLDGAGLFRFLRLRPSVRS